MLGEVQDFVHVCWKEVLSMVNNAAVYIDHAASECLHWYCGDNAYLTLKDAGALSVHELALYNFHNLHAKGAKNAVIISTSTDSVFYQRTLKLIIDKNDFEKCIIVCTAHKKILSYTSAQTSDTEQESSYDNLKGDILHWMNDKTLSKSSQVTMIFKPLFIACLKKDVFVTPPFSDFMPLSIEEFSREYKSDIDFFVSSFHSLFAHYNVIEDIYSLGKISLCIARELNNLTAAVNRKKQTSKDRRVSLILVDRLLDLSTASSHNSETTLGRILCTLPHLPHHHNDVAVLMHPLSLKGEACTSSFMVPGCLATTNEESIDLLLNRKQRDVLLELNKMLINMASNKESPKPNRITRINAHSLEKSIQKFRDSESIESLCKNSKNLQMVAAVVQALKSSKTAQIEFIISLEKLILQNLAISGDSSSILSQLSNIVKTRASRGLEMENLLVLLIYLYALAGPDLKFSKQQEEGLKESLSGAICEDIKAFDDSDSNHELSAYYQTLLLLGASDEATSKEVSVKVAERIIDTLHKLLTQRETLKKYKQVMSKANPHEMARHISILEQLVTDLTDEHRPEIPDLLSVSMQEVNPDKTLKSESSSHPCDNPWIIIYVVGGITPDEIAIVETIKNKKGASSPKITLAGSRLLSPLDIVDRVLLTSINGI
ncbi:hypothetical protein QAD02_018532 [Eretmocerus hayati]|uniref:Uncharacterized protein n=1 Tax=Eretmocerus hayati TaxID=131215 RepID=A0ACC2PLU9_9HYME|nr:hypothetical protein QAD02_018532 [Eretmocerus hayati]